MLDEQIRTMLNRGLADWFAASPSDGTIVSAADSGVVLASARNSRDENEDRVIYAQLRSPQRIRCFSLIAVLDGLGGMVDGARCAELCIGSLITNLISLERRRDRITLIEALQRANTDIFQEYGGRGGTTFAGVFIENNRATSINVGDSHVYHHTSASGLIRKSVDDRLGERLQRLVGMENISLDPNIASRLGQYLGMAGAIHANIASLSHKALSSTGSRVLLVTDGVQVVGNEGMSKLLDQSTDNRAVARALLERASECDNADNTTLIIANSSVLLDQRPADQKEFEYLRVWGTQGIFNFAFPPPEQSARTLPQNRVRRGKSKNPALPAQPSSEKASPELPRSKAEGRSEDIRAAGELPNEGHLAGQDIAKNDILDTAHSRDKTDRHSEHGETAASPKPEVTITQLTFEPLSDEDSE